MLDYGLPAGQCLRVGASPRSHRECTQSPLYRIHILAPIRRSSIGKSGTIVVAILRFQHLNDVQLDTPKVELDQFLHVKATELVVLTLQLVEELYKLLRRREILNGILQMPIFTWSTGKNSSDCRNNVTDESTGDLPQYTKGIVGFGELQYAKTTGRFEDAMYFTKGMRSIGNVAYSKGHGSCIERIGWQTLQVLSVVYVQGHIGPDGWMAVRGDFGSTVLQHVHAWINPFNFGVRDGLCQQNSNIGRSSGQIQYLWRRLRMGRPIDRFQVLLNALYHAFPPGRVHPQRQDSIDQVVPRSDAVKHVSTAKIRWRWFHSSH